jgi:hypothetical protein
MRRDLYFRELIEIAMNVTVIIRAALEGIASLSRVSLIVNECECMTDMTDI